MQACIDLTLFWILSQVGADNVRPRSYVKTFLTKWCEEMGQFLGLSNYLFDEEVDDETAQESMPAFVLKIAVLLFFAWCTMLLLMTIFITVPLSVGRFAFSFVPVSRTSSNDMYLHILGLYIIAGIAYLCYYLYKQAQQTHVSTFVLQLVRYAIIVCHFSKVTHKFRVSKL